jgi:hypothetical protein
VCGYGSVECGPSSLTLALKRSIMIAGWIKNKKELKEKIMTKLYIDKESDHIGRLGQSDREEILSEIWGAKKKLIDGKWYVELSEVAEIVGS